MIKRIYRTWKFKKEVAAMSDADLEIERKLLEERVKKLEYFLFDKCDEKRLKGTLKTQKIIFDEMKRRDLPVKEIHYKTAMKYSKRQKHDIYGDRLGWNIVYSLRVLAIVSGIASIILLLRAYYG